MIMYKTLHPKDNVDRLYASRKEKGRGLTSFIDSMDALIQQHEDYIKKCRGRLITVIRKNTDNTSINRTKTRKQKWEEKELYGHFKWQTSEISHEKTWTWLIKENLKRKTESLLIATQNKAIRTNYIKAKIDKIQQNSRCRLCGDKDETINHIIRKCSKLAQE